MELTVCPHCSARVVMAPNGICPSCRRSSKENEPLDASTTDTPPQQIIANNLEQGDGPGFVAGCAIIFAGFVLVGVFLNLYLLTLSFLTVFVLGLTGPGWLNLQYWICFAGGVYTSYILLRSAWQSSGRRPTKSSKNVPKGPA
jgi:hypothetical protein